MENKLEDKWYNIDEPPKLGITNQSDWVYLTDGKEVVQGVYYDFTSIKNPKPNTVTGKGWHCHGMRKDNLTHWRPIVLPKK
jgi:hypothetical protein